MVRLVNLEELYLFGNRISEIWEYAFVMNMNLKYLWLYDNKIKALPKNVFTNQNKLEMLYLNDNQIAELDGDIFKKLINLTTLLLSNNQLTDLPPNIFSSLTKITSFDLSSNNLTTIHSDSFGTLSNLRSLYFHTNSLDAFDERLINNTNISVINGAFNPCILSHGVINDTSIDRVFIRTALMICFMNYEEREGDTTTTTTTEVTTTTTTTNSNQCIIENIEDHVCYLEDDVQELRYENEVLRGKVEDMSNEMIKMNEKILELATRPCMCK